MKSAGLLVVGTSYAATQLSAAARAAGYGEPIRLLGAESGLPYQKPPLSKGFLVAGVGSPALELRGESFFRDNAIELVTGVRAASVDRGRRRVVDATGRSWQYDTLALATGARARSIAVPGVELDGVGSLRTLDDARWLREQAESAQTVVIAGGGFIGLEVASSLSTSGRKVTVVEALGRLLSRTVSPVVAEFLLRVHESRGVTVLRNTAVARILGSGRANAVELSDGSRLPADLVLVSVGAIPNAELAVDAGLGGMDGVAVDGFGRTADNQVFAAGDCALHPVAVEGRTIRLESVQNANDQARSAGRTIAGTPSRYEAVPWFWSDQYELKIQMTGIRTERDDYCLRGRIEDGEFSVFHLRDACVVAAESVNRLGDHMVSRRIVAAHARATAGSLGDPGFDLRSLLQR